MKIKRIFFQLIFILISSISYGKSFQYSAPLPLPDSSGFFKIIIPPEISSKLNSDFSDLRIIDSIGKETPYILKSNDFNENINLFREYEITSKKFLGDSLTSIVFKNNTGKNINEICLSIRIADVHKQMKILGSFDGRQWYVVKNTEDISSLSNATNVSEVRLINFPLTNYLFYKIEINDKDSPPLDVIKVGYYDIEKFKPVLTELPINYAASDSSKTKSTWIYVTLNEKSFIDKVEFKIASPTYFNRKANIYSEINNRGYYRNQIKQINLNSKGELSFDLPGNRLKEFWIEIRNEDNPPLTISELKLFQYEHYLVAQLEKSKSYKLFFGDSLLTIPHYDLNYFESVIPSSLATLLPGTIVKATMQIVTPAEDVFFTDKRLIWIVLIVVIAFLGFATFRMVNEKK